MPKYRIYGIYTGSKFLGEVEAKNKTDAENIAWEDDSLMDDAHVSVCHQCSKQIDVGDMHDIDVIECE